ncbi:NADP-dependent oxidoreductase domain-containing protein [Rhizoctonia solani]|nr:NADP-dependent oxidoreductase domain-containing protein [Rhizoctonia solani]
MATQSSTSPKKMTYVRLGNSGLKVSRIILGTMSYGSPEWQGWVLGEEEGIKHIKAAYDLGIQTFDTANVYSNGLSEVVLGKAIKQHNLPRDEIVVMTKVYFTVAPAVNLPWANAADYPNRNGLSRKHIFESIQASLKRLQLDYVDVLQCHRFDSDTPVAETMQALHDVVQAGYARYIGMSSCHAWQFHVMQNYAITHNLTPFISMQNHHSLVYREEEREMFPTLKHFGVGVIPWSPLARGYLTKPLSAEKTTRAETDPWRNHYATAHPGNPKIVEKVEEIAKKHGVTMAQIATAWTLTKVTAPIVGTTSLKNLEELAAAVHIQLSEEEIKALEEPYGPQAVFGHM